MDDFFDDLFEAILKGGAAFIDIAGKTLSMVISIFRKAF
jgi:hypothetical protein